MTRSRLHQEFSSVPEIDKFLDNEYDRFIQDYLNEHRLDTGFIPEDMTVQYDPTGNMTMGARALHSPRHVILGPEAVDNKNIFSKEQPLTSCIGEEYIHEFGSNYFSSMDPLIRAEVEEVMSKQWQLFCEGDLHDPQGRQETLQNAESWYNNSSMYRNDAGTRIRKMSEKYIRQFDNSNLSAKGHIQSTLSSPDAIAADYLDTFYNDHSPFL